MIDFYASAPWYVDHMAPVWQLLGPAAGRFHVRRAATLAAARGLRGVTTDPPIGRNPIYTVAYGDHALARRHGRTRLALGQHGAGQSYSNDNPSYPGGSHQEDVGLFLVPNDHAAGRTLQRYPGARVALVGCPKLDGLPRLAAGSPEGIVAISTHWDARIAPEAGSAWGTFRTALLELARTHRVIGHAHPRMISRVAPYLRAARIEVVEGFDEVLARASVYVTDNSSSLFEFAATGRPVVVMNPPTYRRTVHHGLRFWEAATVGINVDHPRDLAAAVDRALECRPEDVAAREAALDLVYQPRQGAAELAAGALLAWACDE